MAVKHLEHVSCDQAGCSMHTPTPEIEQDKPYYHIQAQITSIDATGREEVIEIDDDSCWWCAYRAVNRIWDAVNAEKERRAANAKLEREAKRLLEANQEA